MSSSSEDLGGLGPETPDAPRLPDGAAAPSLPDAGAMPFLPDAPRPVAEPAPEPEFDAKAMVDSQKIKANPAYGGMPQATSETKQAVEKLRNEAAKKKRRSKIMGRLTFVVFCVVVAAVAYVGYRTFQNDQEDGQRDDVGAEQVAPEAVADDGDDPAALTPVGEQAEVIAGLDILSDVPVGRAGGLMDAVDDAQAAVDDLNGVESSDEAPVPVAPVGLPSTIEATVLRYDLGSVADPVVHHVAADLSTDTYLIATTAGGDLGDAAESGTSEVARYDATAGAATRTGRSDASLAPGPDALFVSAVSPSVLLPPSAEPHARATSVGLTGADGSPISAEAFVVDVEAYRSADPEAADAWLTVLGLADPTATLGEGAPDPDTNLPDARSAIDELIARTDGGPVTGNPPIATTGQVVVGWTMSEGEPYVRSAYATSGDGSFQWLYRVASVDGPSVSVFGVR